MHRFYCPKTDLTSSTVSIFDPNEIHHLKNVLRLKKDSLIKLFNNDGEGEYKILSLTVKEVRAEKLSFNKNIPSSSPEIILACAIPKKSKFETIIEKTTELGVSEIIPLQTERTIVQLKGERLDKKTLRYETVAINASTARLSPSHPNDDAARSRTYPSVSVRAAISGSTACGSLICPNALAASLRTSTAASTTSRVRSPPAVP